MESTPWISHLVPPGSVGGNFFIPISNLPLRTDWQDLKDWLKSGCVVSHVETGVPVQGSGWILLQGKKNFDRALAQLQREPYRDRVLYADGSNLNQSIVIFFPKSKSALNILEEARGCQFPLATSPPPLEPPLPMAYADPGGFPYTPSDMAFTNVPMGTAPAAHAHPVHPTSSHGKYPAPFLPGASLCEPQELAMSKDTQPPTGHQDHDGKDRGLHTTAPLVVSSDPSWMLRSHRDASVGDRRP